MVQSVSHENFTSVIKFKLSLVSDEGYKSSPRSMEVCVILSKLKNHNFSAETTGLKDFFTCWYMQYSDKDGNMIVIFAVINELYLSSSENRA